MLVNTELGETGPVISSGNETRYDTHWTDISCLDTFVRHLT